MQKIVLIILVSLSGCSNFSIYRSFEDEMSKESNNFFIPKRDFFVIKGDAFSKDYQERQLLSRTPLQKSYREELQRPDRLKIEKKSLLSNLNEDEKKHYKQFEPLLSNDSEKIYFLQLSSIRERNDYLEGIGIKNKENSKEKESGSVILIKISMDQQ